MKVFKDQLEEVTEPAHFADVKREQLDPESVVQFVIEVAPEHVLSDVAARLLDGDGHTVRELAEQGVIRFSAVDRETAREYSFFFDDIPDDMPCSIIRLGGFSFVQFVPPIEAPGFLRETTPAEQRIKPHL